MDFFDEIIEVLKNEENKHSRVNIDVHALDILSSKPEQKTEVKSVKVEVITNNANIDIIKDNNFADNLSKNMNFPREVEAKSMDDLKNQVLSCNACEIRRYCTQSIAGNGNLNARMMIIGETLSNSDDLENQQFSGEVGELLDKMIKAMGFKDRSEIYLTTILKCRTPGNRAVTSEEVNNCIGYIKKEIELVNPEVIVSFGAGPVKHLIGKNATISNLRGNFLSYNNIKVMPTFNPAYLLKKESAKREVWSDLKQVMQVLGM